MVDAQPVLIAEIWYRCFFFGTLFSWHRFHCTTLKEQLLRMNTEREPFKRIAVQFHTIYLEHIKTAPMYMCVYLR